MHEAESRTIILLCSLAKKLFRLVAYLVSSLSSLPMFHPVLVCDFRNRDPQKVEIALHRHE